MKAKNVVGKSVPQTSNCGQWQSSSETRTQQDERHLTFESNTNKFAYEVSQELAEPPPSDPSHPLAVR
jgi:hypothetical protein